MRRFPRQFLVILTLLAASLAGPQAATAQSLISEPRYASIVVDAASGEVLYSNRADSPRYPASITKMMTLYLAFEAMAAGRLSNSDVIRISPRAAAQAPSRLGLRAGQTIRVDQAINAIAIKSANDVAVAMAEHIAGTETRFAALMTLRAQELGMRNTRYVNANGLPDSRQISSARDIAVLSRALMRDYPQYYSVWSTRSFTYNGVTMNNHNRLLFQMPGVDGIKTGFTNASGYNLAASAVRSGRRLIAIVLGGPTSRSRDSHTRHLLETGFTLMARRDSGERVQLASNLFEQNPVTPSVGSVQQGSDGGEETAPAPTVRSGGPAVTSTPVPNPPTPRPRQTAEIEEAAEAPAAPVRTRRAAAPEPAPTRRASRADVGDWIVQVGAFGSEGDARARIGEVVRRFDTHFDSGDGAIARADSRHWRVRFTGYSERRARAACSALTARREPCMVVAPA